MNRRDFLHIAAPLGAGLLSSCRLRGKRGQSTPPPPSSGPSEPVRFDPGRVPSRLPTGIRYSYSSCQVAGGFCAMTFDDGPHAVHTPRLLAMLRDWDIKATFYLVGKNAAEFPHLVRRIVQEGHEVGNHSWNHKPFSKMGPDAVRSELTRTHQAIVNGCGVAPLTYRPPYGAITAAQKEWIAKEYGYPTIMWSVDPNDWKDRNASLVSSRIRAGARSGSIILAHDIHGSTVDAMPSTLPALRQRGLRFLTVSQLITLEASRQPHFASAAGAEKSFYSPGTF